MDSSLLEAFSSYQATLCVFLIVISVSILWIYVTIIRGKTVEPNFDVLYEKPGTHTTGSKKSLKNKTKSKHVEGSPKPPKDKTVAEVSIPNQAKEKENVKKQPTSTNKTQTASKKQGSKRKAVASIHVESNVSLESENDGEWQTQLSRPQLRALRQMQKKVKDAGAQSPAGIGTEGSSSSSSGGGGGDSSGDGKQTEKGGTTKGQKKKGKQVARKVTDTSPSTDSEEKTATKTSVDAGASGQDPQEVGSTNGELSAEGAAVEGTLSSSSIPVTCNSSVQDVEGALREAALCSGSTSKPEEATLQAQPDTSKTTHKKKRTKRKNKQHDSGGGSKTPVASKNEAPLKESSKEPTSVGGANVERPPSVGQESGDDWVVID